MNTEEPLINRILGEVLRWIGIAAVFAWTLFMAVNLFTLALKMFSY